MGYHSMPGHLGILYRLAWMMAGDGWSTSEYVLFFLQGFSLSCQTMSYIRDQPFPIAFQPNYYKN